MLRYHLGLVVVLVLGILFVMQQLRHAAAVQDCIASGRTNCAPITWARTDTRTRHRPRSTLSERRVRSSSSAARRPAGRGLRSRRS